MSISLVAVERLIDELVSYNMWLLGEDHFVGTRFQFRLARARRVVGEICGAELSASDEVVRWNASGENALGTLTRYLQASSEWMLSLLTKDRDSVKRPEEDLPHFAADEVGPLVFLHTALWADCEVAALRVYSDGYASIGRLIHQATLAEIRNGLDHHRDEERFPTAEMMLASIARLRQAIELADLGRYYPKTYWLVARRGDRFGLEEAQLRDYARRTLAVHGPSIVSGLPDLTYQHPWLVAGGQLLGRPNAMLCFRYAEASVYSEDREGYPRRRTIEVEHPSSRVAAPQTEGGTEPNPWGGPPALPGRQQLFDGSGNPPFVRLTYGRAAEGRLLRPPTTAQIRMRVECGSGLVPSR